MLARLGVPIGWWQLVKRTANEAIRDDAMGLSAQVAFYVVLAVFPVLVCLIALASLFPLQNFVGEVTRALSPFMPAAGIEILRDFMIRIGESRDTGLLSLGLLLAIWSASTPMVAVVNVMNRAYGVTESRAWWRVRLTAILLSAGLGLFIVISFMLVVFGPQLADFLAAWLGLGAAFAWAWKILQWPVVLALVATGIGLVYYFAPDVDQDWTWITPGSVMATLLWLAMSLGFRFYAVNFGEYEATYGALGGMMLLLMWFFVSGIALIVGAELNAEIEHASPWGKDPGERVKGERLKVGAAAERAYAARHRDGPASAG